MNPTTRKAIIVISPILFVLIILVAIFRVATNFYTFNERQIAKIVEAMNKSAPMKTDSVTRFDSVKYLPKDTLVYYYGFVNVAKGDVDTANLESVLYPDMLQEIQEDKRYKYLRDRKITFIYRFQYEDGEWIKELTVTPNQYNHR